MSKKKRIAETWNKVSWSAASASTEAIWVIYSNGTSRIAFALKMIALVSVIEEHDNTNDHRYVFIIDIYLHYYIRFCHFSYLTGYSERAWTHLLIYFSKTFSFTYS